VYAANVTPFRDDANRTLDVSAYRQHVAWMAESGVDGVAAFGTNGEGPSVSSTEKVEVIEAVLGDDLGIDVVPVLTEGNLPDTLWLLERVNDLPVGGVLVLPPYYFHPVHVDGLRAFYERVLEVSRHPVLVYHIPRFSVPVPADLVTSLPVWGVKNSAGDPAYSATVRAAGQEVLVGTEDDLAHDLPDSHGCISALANIVPDQMVEVLRRVRAGEDATVLSEHLRDVSALTREHDSPGLLKVLAQAQHGIPMGTVRPPLVAPPASYDVSSALDRVRATAAPQR
jgi:4-hydroxy-tetrahydrodipicolinate synthase